MSLEAQIEALNENIVKLIGVMTNDGEVQTPAPKSSSSTKKTTGKKPTAKSAPAAKKGASSEATDSAPGDADESESGEEATKDDVKSALIALGEAKGREAAKDLLVEFKAANVSKLAEDQYAEVISRAAELIEE